MTDVYLRSTALSDADLLLGANAAVAVGEGRAYVRAVTVTLERPHTLVHRRVTSRRAVHVSVPALVARVERRKIVSRSLAALRPRPTVTTARTIRSHRTHASSPLVLVSAVTRQVQVARRVAASLRAPRAYVTLEVLLPRAVRAVLRAVPAAAARLRSR